MNEQQRKEVLEKVIERLVDGESLRSICASEDMPDRTTILRWANADDEIAATIARARYMQADALDDDIGDITQKILRKEISPEAGRVAIWAHQWRAGKMKPKKYGDSTTIKGDPAAPIALTVLRPVVSDSVNEKPGLDDPLPGEPGHPDDGAAEPAA